MHAGTLVTFIYSPDRGEQSGNRRDGSGMDALAGGQACSVLVDLARSAAPLEVEPYSNNTPRARRRQPAERQLGGAAQPSDNRVTTSVSE